MPAISAATPSDTTTEFSAPSRGLKFSAISSSLGRLDRDGAGLAGRLAVDDRLHAHVVGVARLEARVARRRPADGVGPPVDLAGAVDRHRELRGALRGP